MDEQSSMGRPTVIITGGAGGLGSRLAEYFAADGWVPVIADVSIEAARRTTQKLEGHGAEAFAVQVDVRDQNSADRMASEVIGRFGRIDALVNNAGLYGDPMWTGSVLEVPLEEWNKVMEINLTGALVCSRAVAERMKTTGWGRIVNISSHGAFKSAGVYSISKFALNHLTWDLAKELGQFGITVNCVGPGSMNLSNNKFARGDASQANVALSSQIIRRFGEPSDIYGAIKYFVSKQADFCTAQTLLVNGGANVNL